MFIFIGKEKNIVCDWTELPSVKLLGALWLMLFMLHYITLHYIELQGKNVWNIDFFAENVWGRGYPELLIMYSISSLQS